MTFHVKDLFDWGYVVNWSWSVVHLLLAVVGLVAAVRALWARQLVGILALLICGFYLRLQWHWLFECCT